MWSKHYQTRTFREQTLHGSPPIKVVPPLLLAVLHHCPDLHIILWRMTHHVRAKPHPRVFQIRWCILFVMLSVIMIFSYGPRLFFRGVKSVAIYYPDTPLYIMVQGNADVYRRHRNCWWRSYQWLNVLTWYFWGLSGHSTSGSEPFGDPSRTGGLDFGGQWFEVVIHWEFAVPFVHQVFRLYSLICYRKYLRVNSLSNHHII